MDWGTDDIVAWLDSDEGQRWHHDTFKPMRYTYFASIKKDSEGSDCEWHWTPGERIVSFALGERCWTEPPITDEMLARPCP